MPAEDTCAHWWFYWAFLYSIKAATVPNTDYSHFIIFRFVILCSSTPLFLYLLASWVKSLQSHGPFPQQIILLLKWEDVTAVCLCFLALCWAGFGKKCQESWSSVWVGRRGSSEECMAWKLQENVPPSGSFFLGRVIIVGPQPLEITLTSCFGPLLEGLTKKVLWLETKGAKWYCGMAPADLAAPGLYLGFLWSLLSSARMDTGVPLACSHCSSQRSWRPVKFHRLFRNCHYVHCEG